MDRARGEQERSSAASHSADRKCNRTDFLDGDGHLRRSATTIGNHRWRRSSRIVEHSLGHAPNGTLSRSPSRAEASLYLRSWWIRKGCRRKAEGDVAWRETMDRCGLIRTVGTLSCSRRRSESLAFHGETWFELIARLRVDEENAEGKEHPRRVSRRGKGGIVNAREGSVKVRLFGVRCAEQRTIPKRRQFVFSTSADSIV